MEILLRLLTWNTGLAALSHYTPDRYRAYLRPLLPLAVLLLPMGTPVERLGAMSLFLLFALKASVMLGRPARSLPPEGLALYFSVWPGMDPTPFERRDNELAFPARWFVQGWVTMIVTAVAVGGLALHGCLSTWAMLAGLLFFVHFGYSDVLSALMRLAGFPVERLFDNPLASTGLRDFWSRRWNRPFVEMNRLLFMPLLAPLGRRTAVVGAFLISGLLHELAITFPAGGGWGGPIAYFVIQSFAMTLEGDWLKRLPVAVRRAWTWAWLLVPFPMLFGPAFHRLLLAPLAALIATLPLFASHADLLRILLTTAGLGHFLVLAAGMQVPWRLGWREELTRLRPLNRKLLWTYYGYIGSFIITFGIVILRLRNEMLAGERGATTLLFIIATFWTARITIDAIIFEHDDWPEGPTFQIGHTLLTSLFVFIAISAWMVLLG